MTREMADICGNCVDWARHRCYSTTSPKRGQDTEYNDGCHHFEDGTITRIYSRI